MFSFATPIFLAEVYSIFGESFRKELEITIAKILVEFRKNGILHRRLFLVLTYFDCSVVIEKNFLSSIFETEYFFDLLLELPVRSRKLELLHFYLELKIK